MKIALAADHAGFELKDRLLPYVESLGHVVLDLGARDALSPDDYPDFAQLLGQTLMDGNVERGILICGSGVGASVAVNKIKGVRGGLCHDGYSAHQGVEHDDMNVLVLGSRVIGIELAKDLVRIFLAARFSGEERHARRLHKIKAMEERFSA
jgi:ribose 5-phosphate isomerase B